MSSAVDGPVRGGDAAALPRELLVVEGARQIRDGDLVIVGTGLPLLAATLAQKTHAPEAKLVIESGVMFPKVVPTPVSVVDPRLMHGASRHGSLFEALGGLVQRGLVRTGFLGGAQVDEYANINSTWCRDRTAHRCGCRAAAGRTTSPATVNRSSS